MRKRHLFALYYGQKVLRYGTDDTDYSGIMKGYTYVLNGTTLESDDKSGYLFLRPVALLLDEDAIAIAKIENDYTDPVRRGWNLVNWMFGEDYEYSSSYSGEFTLKVYHYLLSKGYALPFHGIKVEQQVAGGWIKLMEK